MSGLRALLAEERGVFCLLLLAIVTALALARVVSGDDWLSFARYLVVVLVASKTATGAVETMTGARAPTGG